MATIQQFEYFQLHPNKFSSTQIPVSTIPYVIGEVFIDEVISGDVIWLNAVIGGVDNDNETETASVIFNIYKGNVFITGREIYFAIQEVDRDGDGDVTNVPISYVDAINKDATKVRYVLAVKLEDDIKKVFIRGPITFTALRIRPWVVKNFVFSLITIKLWFKEEFILATIQQFEFFTFASKATDNLIPITSTPTVIGELFIDEVIIGDLIYLNAVVGGLDNDNETTYASFNLKIFRGDILLPGKEIYLVIQEVDKEGDGDVVNVPLSHVDVICKNDTNVKYVLTVEETQGIKNVFVDGPITFTAARIRP